MVTHCPFMVTHYHVLHQLIVRGLFLGMGVGGGGWDWYSRNVLLAKIFVQDPLIPEGYTYEDFVFESSSSEDEVIVVAREVRLVNVLKLLLTHCPPTHERGMPMHAHTQHAGKSIRISLVRRHPRIVVIATLEQ